MLRLIELSMTLSFELAELSVRLMIGIVQAVAGLVKHQSVRSTQAKTDDPARPALPPTLEGQPQALPQPVLPVHVHVTVAAPPQTVPPTAAAAAPASASAQASKAAGNKMGDILARKDHKIYLAMGAGLVELHPKAEELDEMVTRMAFAAMHRHGEPFTVAPALDQSGQAQGAFSLNSEPDAADFAPGIRLTLPAADNALYLVRNGALTLAPAMPLHLPEPPTPPPDSSEDPLLPAPFLIIPPADNQLWLLRAGSLSPLG
jgi:hypothetical protein